MTKRSKNSLAKLRLKRLKKNLQLGRQNLHIKKYTPGAGKLLAQFGRTDIFCPEPLREPVAEKKVRRQKQYERMLKKEAEIIHQEQFADSELVRFLRE